MNSTSRTYKHWIGSRCVSGADFRRPHAERFVNNRVTFHPALAAIVLVWLLPSAAQAQSIDYGALQQLFGQPITTSVTGSPQRASDVPVTMEIITADDIRRSGSYDIPGVLRHVAGVDVLRWNNDNADVGMRGYDQAFSSRLLVLIDGRQVYADFYGFTPWSALPVELSAIRQIEVVKGPNSALFGFNAVDGVINIVTRNPSYDDANQLTLTGGTQGLVQGSALGTFRLGDAAAARISAGGRSDDDFSTGIPAGVALQPQRHNSRGAFDLDSEVRLGAQARLDLEASHTDVAQNQMDPFYRINYARYHTNSLRAQLNVDSPYGMLQATAYTNWITSEVTPGVTGSDYNFHNRVTVAQLQDVFRLGSHNTLRASVEYRYNTESTTPVQGADVFYDVLSAGGMWEWRLTPSVTLTNAVRADHLSLGRSGYSPPGYPFSNADWNRNFNTVSYNSGLVWQADPDDALRFIAGRGVQVPSLVNDGAYLVSSPRIHITGVPGLDPTKVMNYEVGWDHLVPAFNGMLRVSVFRKDTYDIVSLRGGRVQGTGSTYFTPADVGNSRALGMELGAKGAFLQNWSWELDYRLERIRDHLTPMAQGGADLIDFQHVTPLHVANAQIGWSRGPWEANTYLRYQSRTESLTAGSSAGGSVLTPIGSYVSMDGRLGYNVNRWVTLSLSCQNLLQSKQRQTSGPMVERRVLGTLSLSY
jgi:outer membrane receptor for ferrienterochelin and colicins